MKRELWILAACGGLYGINRLWLQDVTRGGLQWFLICYFHDILAGLVLPAVTSLLLRLAGRPPLKHPLHIALLLLGAGVVWECLAPLWKPGAVFDWWDFPAYQAGGVLYLLLSCKNPQNHTENQ